MPANVIIAPTAHFPGRADNPWHRPGLAMEANQHSANSANLGLNSHHNTFGLVQGQRFVKLQYAVFIDGFCFQRHCDSPSDVSFPLLEFYHNIRRVYISHYASDPVQKFSQSRLPPPTPPPAKIAAQQAAYGQQTPRIGPGLKGMIGPRRAAAPRPNDRREDGSWPACRAWRRASSARRSRPRSQRQRRQLSDQACAARQTGQTKLSSGEPSGHRVLMVGGVRRPGDRRPGPPARPPPA